MWWLFYLFSFRDKTNCFHKPCTQNTTASYLKTFYFSTCASPFRVSFCKNIILPMLAERGVNVTRGLTYKKTSYVLPQKFVTVSVEAEIIYSIWVEGKINRVMTLLQPSKKFCNNIFNN